MLSIDLRRGRGFLILEILFLIAILAIAIFSIMALIAFVSRSYVSADPSLTERYLTTLKVIESQLYEVTSFRDVNLSVYISDGKAKDLTLKEIPKETAKGYLKKSKLKEFTIFPIWGDETDSQSRDFLIGIDLKCRFTNRDCSRGERVLFKVKSDLQRKRELTDKVVYIYLDTYEYIRRADLVLLEKIKDNEDKYRLLKVLPTTVVEIEKKSREECEDKEDKDYDTGGGNNTSQDTESIGF